MYWDYKSLYQRIKDLMAGDSKLTLKQETSMCTRRSLRERTNPPRKRFSGATEVARRQRQVAKGFVKVN